MQKCFSISLSLHFITLAIPFLLPPSSDSRKESPFSSDFSKKTHSMKNWKKNLHLIHIWYTGFKAVSFSLKFHIFFRNKWKQLGLSTDSTELKYVVIETVTLMEMKINFNSCLRRLLNFINYISAKLFS